MTAADDVTVCIPSIPPRWKNGMVMRALESVSEQTHPAAAVSIAVDLAHEGAWVTRQRALDAARTPWVAFLDDDDAFMPEHLAKLLAHAVDTDADFVYSYFKAVGMMDPFIVGNGRDGLLNIDFDPATQTGHTTMVVMVRRELAQQVGFTAPHPDDVASGEDWRFSIDCAKVGAVISHLHERTWWWFYHPDDSRNTSGQPFKW